MRPLLHLAAGALVAVVLVGCDPTNAIVVNNESSRLILIGRFLSSGDAPSRDVVPAPPNSTVTVATHGVASLAQLHRVVVMTEDCQVLADELLTEGFADGGQITVSSDLEVSLVGGGNPPREADVSSTEHCLSAIEGLPDP